jgi:tRNA(fMet)-specific endonuclease VapC
LIAPVYILDTDTCIFLMRGGHPILEKRVQEVPLQQQVISVMTFAELTYGVKASASAKRKQNQVALDNLALYLAIVPWPQDAAEHYAEIRLDLKKRGAQLGAAVLMIAAHARAMEAVVVTNNSKDFGRVKGLRVENWVQ